MYRFIRLSLVLSLLLVTPYCSSVSETNLPNDAATPAGNPSPNGDAAGPNIPSDTNSDSEDPPVQAALMQETFSLNDGDPWPAPWLALDDSGLDVFAVENGRGHLTGDDSTGYGAFGGLSRVYAPTTPTVDFDATYKVIFDDFSQQGVGFYGRHNGGFLTLTSPQGHGYGVFLEGYSMTPCLGFWYEIDGIESQQHCTPVSSILPGSVLDGVEYQLRYRVEQINGDETMQRARLWPVGSAEPDSWQAELLSDAPVLQNLAGGFVIDVFNRAGSDGSGIYLDDIVITELP